MTQPAMGIEHRDANSTRREIMLLEKAHRRAVNKIAELQGRRKFKAADATDSELTRLEDDVVRHARERDRAAARVAALLVALQASGDCSPITSGSCAVAMVHVPGTSVEVRPHGLVHELTVRPGCRALEVTGPQDDGDLGRLSPVLDLGVASALPPSAIRVDAQPHLLAGRAG